MNSTGSFWELCPNNIDSHRPDLTGAFSSDSKINADMDYYLYAGQYRLLQKENFFIICNGPISPSDPGHNSYLFMEGSFFQKQAFLSALEMNSNSDNFNMRDDNCLESSILQRIIAREEFSLLRDLYAEFCGIFISRDKIMLISDRRSSMPIFYTLHNNILYFSSSPFHLLKITGKKLVIEQEQLYELELFNNILDTDQIFKDIFFVRPGSVLLYDKDKTLKKIRYINHYEVRDNSQISKKEICYELSRLLARSLDLVTRGLDIVYVQADSFESILCMFLLPFERLSLTAFFNDDRLHDILSILKMYYEDRLILSKTDKKENMPGSIHNRKNAIIFTNFLKSCNTNLTFTEYTKQIREHIKKKMNITGKYEVEHRLRDYLLDNADQSIICKIVSGRYNLLNPFQEPFFRDFLRSADPSFVNKGMVFDLISKSILFKKLLKGRNISLLKKHFRPYKKNQRPAEDIPKKLSEVFSKMEYRKARLGEIEKFCLK